MKFDSGQLIFSPSDLIRYLESPFASWMDRYDLENPGQFNRDPLTEDAQLVINMGIEHEAAILNEFRANSKVTEMNTLDEESPETTVLDAISARVPVIYQAKLEHENFAGYADFIILDDESGLYQIWDTKLARSIKPYYVVQLCCYSEMLAAMTGEPMPEKFGVILGVDEKGIAERIELRIEDFIHYYRQLKRSFLETQSAFDGNVEKRPEPHPSSDHGWWNSEAKKYLKSKDHLAQVAGIVSSQIKKLNDNGILTMSELAAASEITIPKMPQPMLDKLRNQAALQKETEELRKVNPDAKAKFYILPATDENGRNIGLGAIPPINPADVFFDMEGYELTPGGLEYLFGNTIINPETKEYEFVDFWAHDREQEKRAFEDFIDWVYARWRANPGMHIYHYAVYEVSAVRKLSTRHDTRQEEVDTLLRHEVFVDLYKVVRQGVRIGEPSYSLKKVEDLYWAGNRTGVVTMSIGSMVHYARWILSGEPGDWEQSPILKEIRDYNRDDCDSTAELAKWLRQIAADHDIPPSTDERATRSADQSDIEDLNEEVKDRLEAARRLRQEGGQTATALADLVDFHRREDKPFWWKFFDRIDSEADELRDDAECIVNVEAVGEPVPEKRSLLQEYTFDSSQECKLLAGKNSTVVFTHGAEVGFDLFDLDVSLGSLKLKATNTTLENFGGAFPEFGTLVSKNYVNPKPIPSALESVAADYLSDKLNPSAKALLTRKAPAIMMQRDGELTKDYAIRLARSMSGGCLVIQGPPGTGKTYTASHVIAAILADGKKIGIASNSHKAIHNLLRACGSVLHEQRRELVGVKVGGDRSDEVFSENRRLQTAGSGDAFDLYSEGVIAGTAWLFSREEWKDQLDYLFIDEAGQVALANVIAMSRSAKNLVLLGDQMQLEQPIQGSHPGDAWLSGLQYTLKDTDNSTEDEFVFHPWFRKITEYFSANRGECIPRFVSSSLKASTGED